MTAQLTTLTSAFKAIAATFNGEMQLELNRVQFKSVNEALKAFKGSIKEPVNESVTFDLKTYNAASNDMKSVRLTANYQREIDGSYPITFQLELEARFYNC